MGRGQTKRRKVTPAVAAAIFFLHAVIMACSLTGTGGTVNDGDGDTVSSVTPSETVRPADTATITPTATSTPTPGPGTFFDNDQFSEAGYLLPLTVQYISDDEAILYFELEIPAPGYVLYRQESVPISDASFIPLDSGESVHLLTLDGLEPDSVYQLDIGLEGENGVLYPPAFRGEAWDTISTHTLPENPERLRIASIGDAGFGEEITHQLISMIADEELDFVFYTGDVVTNMWEEAGDPFLSYWLKYYQNFRPVLEKMTIYPVPGNHEYDYAARWQDLPFYFHAFPAHPGIAPGQQGFDGNRHWYALELGDIQFLMLDSETIYGAPGREEMQAWLEERLKDDRFSVTIPVHHIPPFTSGIYTEEGIPFQQLWHPLYVEAGVPLVLSGHDHNYQRLLVDGITYMVSGGGSSITYAIDELLPQNQFARRISHYLILEVRPDALELWATSYKGEQIDHVIIPLD